MFQIDSLSGACATLWFLSTSLYSVTPLPWVLRACGILFKVGGFQGSHKVIFSIVIDINSAKNTILSTTYLFNKCNHYVNT